MLSMLGKGIRGGICHAIHRYAKVNKKYMNNYDKNKESSYIQYVDGNNLYWWTTSQKLPVDGFKWVENLLLINKKVKKIIKLIKKYDEESDEGFILEVDIKYLKSLHDLHGDLSFLPERMKINKSSKLVCNLYDKKLCCLYKSFQTSNKSWSGTKKRFIE